jgi:hypothetical protein
MGQVAYGNIPHGPPYSRRWVLCRHEAWLSRGAIVSHWEGWGKVFALSHFALSVVLMFPLCQVDSRPSFRL